VNFVAAGLDPTEGPEVLRAYQQSNGYPWTVAVGDRELVQRYNVTSVTMGKYGVDRRGIIAFRGGHEVDDTKKWERVFEGLLQP
jgi:hypothetical protein